MYRIIDQTGQLPVDNVLLATGGNSLNYSLIKELDTRINFRSFSIKYVIDGTEKYFVNGKCYEVNQGQYLLANDKCEGSIIVENRGVVRGVCIDIANSLLSEIAGSRIQSGIPFPDADLDKFFVGENFLENKYDSSKTALGPILTQLGNILSNNPLDGYEINHEMYFAIAECIVQDQLPIYRSLSSINKIKSETRKELYRRLLRGKDYLDNNIAEKVCINAAARFAALSEYYFFRLFRASFGISPQQYLISKRLSEAVLLIESGNYSLSEVSIAVGFSDIYSFSKCFKNHFGCPPSKFVERKAGLDK